MLFRSTSGSDVTGGAEYLYVGQFDSSVAQSGGISNVGFGWPLSTASMTWEVTAYDSSNGVWCLKLTNIVTATGWGGVVNYQAVAQPNAAGTGYQTGLTNNYLALGSDTSNLWFWYKTTGTADRTIKFTLKCRLIGHDFS